MSDILDPAEIDALMGGLPRQEASSEEQGSSGSEKYDFASQDYAVHRLIPALSLIQTQFAENFKQRTRQWINTVSAVQAERIAVMKFGEIKRSLVSPCDISLIEAAPLGAPLFLVFESDLVFTLVDQFFGGRGKPLMGHASGSFSPTESRFMDRLSQALMPDIAAAWESAVPVSPRLVERHIDFRFIDGLSETDTVMATRFAVTVAHVEAAFWLVVPWAAIDPIRERLGGSLRTSRQDHDAQWRSRLQSGVEETQLELVAELTRLVSSLKKVSRLQVGDILPIESPGQVTLCIEGVPMLAGSFGAHQGQMAVRIEHTLGPQAHMH